MNRRGVLEVGDDVIINERWLSLREKFATGNTTKVFRAQDLWAGAPVVVKQFWDMYHLSPRALEAAKHWKAVRGQLLALGVPDILYCDGKFQLTQYVPGSNLDDCATNLKGLGVNYVKQILLETFMQIAVLIDHGLVHGDIKGGNVVLTHGNGRLGTLIDFDLMRPVDFYAHRERAPFGTGFFIPHELIMLRESSQTGDVFLLGMMGLELLNGGVDGSTIDLQACGIEAPQLRSRYVWPPTQLKASLAEQLLVREPAHRRDIHGLVNFVNASVNSDPAARPKSLQEAEQLLSDTGNLTEI